METHGYLELTMVISHHGHLNVVMVLAVQRARYFTVQNERLLNELPRKDAKNF